DLEVERGHLLVAHVARHPQTLEHTTGERARTDRAGRTVVLVVAVAGALAAEVVALHAACEALAAADAGDIDTAAGREPLDRDLLADLEPVDRVDAELDQAHARLDAGLGVVPGDRLGELLRVAVALGDLQRRVSVALGRLDLDDAHGLDAEN